MAFKLKINVTLDSYLFRMIIDSNEIILRPRFKFLVKENHLILIEKFREIRMDVNQKYISKVVQNYILMDIPAAENRFWSPQLELRVEKMDDNTSEVSCLFGPKGIVWTFFMFLHFICAGVFFVFFVITYANWILKKAYLIPLGVCISMIILWISLYIIGRIGKKLAQSQMRELRNYLNQVFEREVFLV
ncbi:MAG: GTP-binding protein [Flavobacteriaceae bacterium]|nr:GTP-binding protein [Flavobacteriaceae bacterium]